VPNQRIQTQTDIHHHVLALLTKCGNSINRQEFKSNKSEKFKQFFKLVNRISHNLQECRSQEAQSFAVVFALTELIKPLSNCPGLSEAQQLEFIEVIDTYHPPPNDIHTPEGDLFFLLLKTDTWPGWEKADVILPYR
jgi:hypothetical protein